MQDKQPFEGAIESRVTLDDMVDRPVMHHYPVLCRVWGQRLHLQRRAPRARIPFLITLLIPRKGENGAWS